MSQPLLLWLSRYVPYLASVRSGHTRCCVLPWLHAVQVNTTDVQAVVSGYISCLVAADPGFACPLAASIMAADYVVSAADGSRSYAPRHYVGVLQWMPELQVGVLVGWLGGWRRVLVLLCCIAGGMRGCVHSTARRGAVRGLECVMAWLGC